MFQHLIMNFVRSTGGVVCLGQRYFEFLERKWLVIVLSIFIIRPQNFCGRIMLWRSRRRLWKYGLRAITLVVVNRLLWNFDMMFVTTTGRLVLILGNVAPTVLVRGAKRGEMGIFFKIIVEWLFFMWFWGFFLHCILDQILSTKCANGFHEIWTVSKLWGVKKEQRPKKSTFLFLIRF